MRLAAFAVSATLLACAAVTPASAVPSTASHAAVEAGGGATLVAQKKFYKKKGMHKHRSFRPGGRYKHAPKGWHRFDRRPDNWSRRGCIIVGPIWWCP